MRLLLIRHGESVGNVEGRYQGHTDYPLTERGRDQARRLARRLADVPLAAVYTSTLARAAQTAAAIAEPHGLPVADLPDVREYDVGPAISGLTWREVRERHPEVWAAFRERSGPYPALPGEEGREAFRARVCAALWALEAPHPDGVVAVVTHGGPIAVFCLAVLGLPYRRPLPFQLDNASLTAVEVRGGRGALLTVNDTCHLVPE